LTVVVKGGVHLNSGVMKKVTLIVCLIASAHLTFGQLAQALIHQKSDCAAVTQRIMEQTFSVERQLELENSPEDLACLNYICAQSYEFEKGQTILRSQKALFNIETYKHLRRVDQRVTVYDERSGLSVVLHSWNEVETALGDLRASYRLVTSN
jgi:hypothetical protein